MMQPLQKLTSLMDRMEHWWEGARGQRVIGSFLVIGFIAAIIVIEINRLTLLPEPLKSFLPTNHLLAIEVAFNLLLITEIVSLIFSLTHSVSISVGKQFEVLSLILIRDTFKEFSHFSEPLMWNEVLGAIDAIIVTPIAAIAIFVVLGFYYRVQRHRPITRGEEDQIAFVTAKKLIAMVLLAFFVVVTMGNLWEYLLGRVQTLTSYETFYTALIFSDVLLVLLSLRYGATYHAAFRNSGFAVATVLIRLALIAPVIITGIMGFGAALLALGLSLAYNAFIDDDKTLALSKLEPQEMSSS